MLAHASLVIGGTGMLAAATRWLAARSSSTIIVARRASSFACDAGGIIAVDADWHAEGFADLVIRSLERVPNPRAALLWLHEPKPVLHRLLPVLGMARIVLVLGRMNGRPEDFCAENVVTVRLGSVLTQSGHRRWLTHEEISAGAIASLRDGHSRICGELLL